MKWGKNLIGVAVAVILVLSLILIPVVSRLSPVQAAVTWTKYPGEVTLKYPVTLDNELYVVDAWVIRESSTSYKMWYTHGKKDLSISAIIDVIKGLSLDAIIGDISNLDLAQFLNDLDDLTGDVSAVEDLLDGISTVIGYATSTDGITWTVQNSQALVGSSSAAWDSVGAPCVIKNSDTDYEMWYTRAKTTLTQTDLNDILTDIASTNTTTRKNAILDLLDSTSSVIGYATSDNGASWTVQDSEVLPGSSSSVWDSVADPSVVKTDGSYEMWYTRPETDLTQASLDTILANIGTFGIDDLLDILDGSGTVIGYATSDNGVNWTVPDSQVLPVGSGVGAWDSVADPSVVKAGGSYEMWYTNVKTNLLKANLHTLASEIGGLDIAALWTTLKDEGIVEFIVDLVALDIDTIKSVLSNTSVVIGYATSNDGVSWTVQNSQHLVGSSGSPWSSVAAPSVVKTGDRYEMWYTEGIADLTWQNLLDLVFGDNLPIGYAYYTPRAPTPRRDYYIETNLFGIEASFRISSTGEILETIEATSDAGDFTITIPEGTIALDEDGDPLSTFTVELDLDPPDPPAGAHIIGIPYKFGPSGATFSPSMTIEFTVDPATLPPGIDMEDLVIAYYDETLVPPAWVELTTTYDPATNTFTAEVEHFTTFAIIAVVPVVPPVEEEEEPEVVITVTPAAFSVSYLSVSRLEVEPGETVTIAVLVANTGGESGSYAVVLKINGVKEAEERVTIAAGSSQTVSFSVTREEAGTYSVDVSGLTGSFTVKEKVVPPVVPKPIAWWVWLIVGLGMVVIGGLLAFFLWWRRRIT